MASGPVGNSSFGSGNNKLSGQNGNTLPLPNLSGRGNGPVGKL